jgi:ribonucleoside-triphosphate reductase (thioredoxin)
MKYITQISKTFVNKYKNKEVNWGPLGYITYKRTYSRDNEEWYQTIERCCQGLLEIGGVFTQLEMETLYDYVFNLKCSFSGRALWQLGTATVQNVGADSLINCWHVAINELNAFCFTFNQLMLGGGVGFNLTPEMVYELPTVKHGVKVQRKDDNDVDFIVPDNREGWVNLLRKVLNCYFITGKNLTYSTLCIRQKGKPIKTFGGTASGSEGLVNGIRQITNILDSRVNHKLRPIDCLDILNIIGSIVVAGNVRRSAELALGSYDDSLFINAKNWKNTIIPNWRNMSNNSVICDSIESLPEEFWDGYFGNGEPYGLVNLELCKKYGRIGDIKSDSLVTGTNPCGEITLEPYEACNLAEIFLPNIHSKDEFYTATNLIYKVCKTISKYPFSDPRVNNVVQRNNRLGIGVSGILQSGWICQPTFFASIYDSLEELDNNYSRLINSNTSIKLTTVKPSGTLSLLPGVTPGIHPAYAKNYIRRIRFSSDDPLIKLCRDNGYKVEPQINIDGTRNLDTMVIEFPIETPPGTITKISAIDQLKMQIIMQEYWSDNAVSMTCYYRSNELDDIKKFLKENYTDYIKTVSFLLHSDHGFVQAPYEEITHVPKTQTIKTGVSQGPDLLLECESGVCPTK